MAVETEMIADTASQWKKRYKAGGSCNHNKFHSINIGLEASIPWRRKLTEIGETPVLYRYTEYITMTKWSPKHNVTSDCRL